MITIRLKQIGTVEILKDRFYSDTEHGEVLVPAGTYRLFENFNGGLIFELVGYPAIGSCTPERIGEGLFLIDPSDRVRDTKTVHFLRPIKVDRDEFLTSELCTEGHPKQRLRIKIEASQKEG